jgi:hypothetical protein
MSAIKIGCIFAPDHCRRCQEVLKCVLATPMVFLHFFGWLPAAQVALGLSVFVLPGVLLLG